VAVIEPMKERHLRGVVAIEELTSTRPWSLRLFESELRQNASRCFVAVDPHSVVAGFACLLTTGFETHVTNLAVDPSRRRCGLGRELMCRLVDETIALRARRMRDAWLPGIMAGIAVGLGITRDWVAADDLVEWVEPDGGVVCFPRIRPDADVDLARFHRVLMEEHATVVGPGHWFERPDSYMRIGYGWPTRDRLVEGLENVSAAIRRAQR